MAEVEQAIGEFEIGVLIPALGKVSQSPRLLEDYAVEVVAQRPSADPDAEELLSTLDATLRRRAGPSLVITDRNPPPGVARLGGRYAMTVFYEVVGDEAYAAPAVMCWMKFNNNLHAFAHRYDMNVARHPVGDITREHVLNHILNSFDFYKLFAYSEKPFPGYG